MCLPWSPWASVFLFEDGTRQWRVETTGHAFVSGPMLLSRVSPFLQPPEHVELERPVRTRLPVGILVQDADGFWFTPDATARCAIDGRWCDSRTRIHHGAVLDLCVGLGAPASVQLLLGPGPAPVPPDDAVVAIARAEGAFTLTGDSQGHLAGGSHSLRLDSLSWLERIVHSPLQLGLRSLALDLWHPDAFLDWPAFVERHRAIARLAPFEVTLVEPPPLAPTPQGSVARSPQALFPADGWRQRPLVLERGVWTLRHDGEAAHFSDAAEGLVELTSAGQPGASMPYFRAVPSRRERWPRTLSGFLLLPGPSGFLSGQTLLGPRPLTREAISVFADELNEADDAAGPLLSMACRDDAGALAALWAPYAGAFEGTHCCGFFEAVTLEYWARFELDLPVLAGHPMLQRLRVMRVRDEGGKRRSAEARAELVARLEEAWLRCRPRFELFFEGQRLGA